MKLKKSIMAVRLLAKWYRNWIEVAISYAIKRYPSKGLLRNGVSITQHSTRSPYFLISLARLLEHGWSVTSSAQGRVALMNEEGVRFVCRTDREEDIFDLRAIFVDEIYRMNVDGKVVLDVGMYNADSSIYFVEKGARLVIGVEPHPESYDLALLNVRMNSLQNRIIPINAALTLRDGETLLRLSDDSELGHSTEPRAEYGNQLEAVSATVSVRAMTVETLLRSLKIDQIDCLKLNCEGCEYELLGWIKPEILEKAGEILIQYHSGPASLIAILSGSGFRAKDLTPGEQHGMLHGLKQLA